MTDVSQNQFDMTEAVMLGDNPNVAEAKAFPGPDGKPKGDKKFGVKLLFKATSDDLAKIKAITLRVAAEEWPGRNIGAEYQAGTFNLPFKVGDKEADKRNAKCVAKGKKPDGDYQRGLIVVTARSGEDKPPSLGVNDGGLTINVTSLNRNRTIGRFFFGANVKARLYFKAYKGGNGNDGVTAYLNILVAYPGGTRMGGGPKEASEVFGGYAGKVTDANPLDDQIPF